MEIFIKNVPERATENALRSHFEKFMDTWAIEDWMCQKLGQEPFAKLILLFKKDGEKFLRLYNQGQMTKGPAFTFKGVKLTCLQGIQLDNYAIRSLEMAREARAAKKEASADLGSIASRENSQIFDGDTISCGLWDYIGSDLVYRPYAEWKARGFMQFYSKSIVLTTANNQRIDILFSSIESVTYGGSLQVTFTLREAPRFFQLPDPDLSISMFQRLSIHNASSASGRLRLSALGKEHAAIAGICFVYQIRFKNGKVDDQIRALSHARGIPPAVRRHIKKVPPQERYGTEFKDLMEKLSPKFTGLPFSIRFQLQTLAQNGYMSPTKVASLIPEVDRMFLRSGSRICVNVIRRLSLQVPYAGPDVNSVNFEVEFLVKKLREIEEMSKSSGHYLAEPIGSQNVAVIHKATVTPCGVYLEGPEAESNNRVLRKYSKNHDCFLRVQFCDEDGERVQYSSGSSNDLVYDRFRKILNEGISIAGMHFAFLGFSHSSLRDQSCWFMAPFTYNGSLIYDREVIKELGGFSHIRASQRSVPRELGRLSRTLGTRSHWIQEL